MAASVSGSEVSDGPVLSLINKKLRALRKKYNRIIQTEERQAQGKPLNKEQEEVLKSKPVVAALIEEYDKLRQPIAAAVQEELSRVSPLPPPPPTSEREEEDKASSSGGDFGLLDLVGLLYFSCLFDVKPQGEYTATMLARAHERLCCLTYDYVRDDDAPDDMLSERDIDLIAALGGMITSKPVYSGVSHKNALEGCIQHARLWLQKSDLSIHPESSVTYKGLREKVNKIMASDYFTATPEMKVTDVAAEMERYNSAACQVQIEETGVVQTQGDVQVDAGIELSENKEDEQELLRSEASINEPTAVDETQKDEASTVVPSGDSTTDPQAEETLDEVVDHNQDFEHKSQHQYAPRRGGYQNQRGGRGGGSRRGFSNGRGGRGARLGGGRNGYENGRSQQQYYDSGYYPRSYYNGRGRGGGGRSGGSAAYGNNNHGGPATHGGHVAVGASN